MERSILQVITEQLPQIGSNDFGVNELCAVILGTLVGRYMKKFFFEGGVYVSLQFNVITEQLFQIFFAYLFSIGGKVLIYQFGRTVEDGSEQGGVNLCTDLIGGFQSGNVAVVEL